MIVFMVRAAKWRLLTVVGVAWALTGPIYLAFTNAYALGYYWLPIIRPWAESALVGVVLLWVAVLMTLQMYRVGHTYPSEASYASEVRC